MSDTRTVQAARQSIARHLAELHRLHLALADDSRSLKDLTVEGRSLAEIEIATELLEQYMAASAAFLENMRGRFETRLVQLRREPYGQETAPGQGPSHHGHFWYAFSRLRVALRQAEQRTR